jgi:hypothetical protein
MSMHRWALPVLQETIPNHSTEQMLASVGLIPKNLRYNPTPTKRKNHLSPKGTVKQSQLPPCPACVLNIASDPASDPASDLAFLQQLPIDGKHSIVIVCRE